MACNSAFAKGPVLVYSAQEASTWLFFPVTGAMTTTGLDKTRAALELQNISGNLQPQPALQYSDDGVTCGSAVYFGDTVQTTERTSNGTTYASGCTELVGQPGCKLAACECRDGSEGLPGETDDPIEPGRV